jgi:hypothetical protein
VICVLASHATAGDKPTTAVRIEAKDGASAKTAIALTKALRTQAGAKHSTNVDKTVIDTECDVLQPRCAASIGDKLAVTHMLVGQLERRGSRYTITLSLINVSTKQRVRSLREVAPIKVDVRRWARTLYSRLLAEGSGDIVITANAKRGQVLIDGLVVTELYEGRATVSGVALGTHQLEVRAAGYRPYASDISVDGHSEETILLEPTQ